MTSNDLRRVTVIGCGLIGTSIALALTRAGVEVALDDCDADAVMQARLMGAGRELEPHAAPADVVVIATPPAAVVDALYDAQTRALGYAYTDVAGVKELIWNEAELRACDLMGYVPGHPMAGRERSGAGAAEVDLFVGRPWVLCPYPTSQPEAVEAVAELVALCGGIRRDMAPEEHDEAVAAVSHVPQLVASALAAQLTDVAGEVLALGGGGVGDTTRIAGSDPTLWSDIFAQNPEAVAEVVDRIAAELAEAARQLRDPGSDGSTAVDELLERGNQGRAALLAAQDSAFADLVGLGEHRLDEDAFAAGMADVERMIVAVESGEDIGTSRTTDAATDGGSGGGPVGRAAAGEGEHTPGADGDERPGAARAPGARPGGGRLHGERPGGGAGADENAAGADGPGAGRPTTRPGADEPAGTGEAAGGAAAAPSAEPREPGGSVETGARNDLTAHRALGPLRLRPGGPGGPVPRVRRHRG
jgi:prephenate dehydrogenase